MRRLLLLHGPNLNLLGTREPDVYGATTLEEVNRRLVALAQEQGVELRTFQSNSEGGLVDALHEAMAWADGVIFNPGAENKELKRALERDGIEVEEACTLVLLNTGQF